MKPCSVHGCEKPLLAKGLCTNHYALMRRNGTVIPKVKQARKGEGIAFLKSLPLDSNECISWPYGKGMNGYGVVTFEGKSTSASRACAIIHWGKPPSDDMQAAHSCGNGHKGCVNPKHLRWATPLENTQEKHQHGTSPVGSRHPSAIITESDVVEIRRLWGQVHPAELSRKYGIRPTQVRAVATRKSWKHVQ